MRKLIAVIRLVTILLLFCLTASAQLPPKVVEPPNLPTNQTVMLRWNPSTDPSVVGYNVYYGNESSNYTYCVSAGDSTNLAIQLPLTGRSYFAATTYNASGVQSPFSNEISFSRWGTQWQFTVSVGTLTFTFLLFTNVPPLPYTVCFFKAMLTNSTLSILYSTNLSTASPYNVRIQAAQSPKAKSLSGAKVVVGMLNVLTNFTASFPKGAVPLMNAPTERRVVLP